MSNSKHAAGASMFMKRYGQQAQAGAPPGSIHSPEGALPSKMRATCYGPDEVVEVRDCSLQEIESLRGKYQVLWIDLVGLRDEALIEQIGKQFKLHRLALGDVAHVPQRSKVEHYQDHLFLILHLPRISKKHPVEQISFFLGKDFIISWRERPGGCFAAVRERLQTVGRPIRQSGCDYLLYALIDAVIDAHFPVLEKLGETLDELDEAMEAGATPSIISRMHGVRHDVRLLRRIVWPMREAVDSLAREHGWLIGEETSLYLRDCHDHAIQIIDTLENYREACSDLREYYATEVSNRMNEVMKVLTVIATIFIPLSFIAGLYGMNFDPEVSDLNMPELRWRWGYPMALGLMATVAFGQLMFFRWKGWLGGTRKRRGS